MEDFSGREATTKGQDAYIDAIYALATAICKEDKEVKQLEERLRVEMYARDALQDDIFQRKADLIALYTQVHLRGGVN